MQLGKHTASGIFRCDQPSKKKQKQHKPATMILLSPFSSYVFFHIHQASKLFSKAFRIIQGQHMTMFLTQQKLGRFRVQNTSTCDVFWISNTHKFEKQDDTISKKMNRIFGSCSTMKRTLLSLSTLKTRAIHGSFKKAKCHPATIQTEKKSLSGRKIKSKQSFLLLDSRFD